MRKPKKKAKVSRLDARRRDSAVLHAIVSRHLGSAFNEALEVFAERTPNATVKAVVRDFADELLRQYNYRRDYLQL